MDKLKSDNISFPALNKWQIVWINKYIKAGGSVFIFKETLSDSSLQIYRPLSSFTDPRSVLRGCRYRIRELEAPARYLLDLMEDLVLVQTLVLVLVLVLNDEGYGHTLGLPIRVWEGVVARATGTQAFDTSLVNLCPCSAIHLVKKLLDLSPIWSYVCIRTWLPYAGNRAKEDKDDEEN